MSLGNEHKERLVNMFLRGESVTDLSAFYAVHRATVENVLREAITQLAALAAKTKQPESAGTSLIITDGPSKEQTV